MKKLSIKLLIALIIFAITVISVMSLTNRYILFNDIAAEQVESRKDIETNISTNLSMMDKAHTVFQQLESEEMKKGLHALRLKYEQNPDVKKWDLEEIKKTYGPMDFYVLNNKGQVVVTTHEPSKNMDFRECCTDFVLLIKKRLQTDAFYFDGLEISVAAKDPQMFSYLATKDHRYLLEFGISFKDTKVAQQFNYENTVKSLINNHADLEALRIMTYDGFVLNNDPTIQSFEDLDESLQKAFWKTTKTGKVQEIIEEKKDGAKLIHRFIPYKAEESRGNATNRVVYAKYNNSTEQKLIQKNTTQFFMMLGAGLVTSIVLLIVILKLLNNTIRLATYDTLTGAYNRASYLQYMDSLIGDRQHHPVGLMLVDLDNFKQVNDVYGHAAGDAILIDVTAILKKVTAGSGYVVRFGGDEFAIVFKKATAKELKQYGEALLEALRERKNANEQSRWSNLSMSIGATLQQESTEEEKMLFERADKALYISKNNGKDSYTFLAPLTTQMNNQVKLSPSR